MALELTYRHIDDATVTQGFRCGERELDRFFGGSAKRAHDRGTILTTCAYMPGIAAPVGYYSVASVAEEVRHLPGHSYHLFGSGGHFPCLQLVYLAVNQPQQGQGIGTSMAGAVTELFADIGPKIGLPHLILVPINDNVIPFYEGLGFNCYLGTARMFLPLQSALEAMSTPPAGN